MHTRASNSKLVEPLPEPERTLNRRLRRRNRRVPFEQRNTPPAQPKVVYAPILNINYFRYFLDILENYNPMDDEPMWVADRVVAPTPGSAITIPETANEFAIKALFDQLLEEIRAFSKHENETLTEAGSEIGYGVSDLLYTAYQTYSVRRIELLQYGVLGSLGTAYCLFGYNVLSYSDVDTAYSLKSGYGLEFFNVLDKSYRVGTERITFSIDSAMKHSYSNDDTCFRIDVIDEILEEDFDALLNKGSKILHSIEGTILKEKLFAEFMAMTADEN
ncbi:hypothetical protein Tco_1195130 [Tanacetum coccineum]